MAAISAIFIGFRLGLPNLVIKFKRNEHIKGKYFDFGSCKHTKVDTIFVMSALLMNNLF